MGSQIRSMKNRHGRRLTGALFACAALLLLGGLFPPGAMAAQQVVDRQVTQTTGAEMALDALAGLRRVDVDSSGVTLLIDDRGESRDLRVDLGGFLGTASDASGDSAIRFGALAVVAGLFLRAVRSLIRLGRDEA